MVICVVGLVGRASTLPLVVGCLSVVLGGVLCATKSGVSLVSPLTLTLAPAIMLFVVRPLVFAWGSAPGTYAVGLQSDMLVRATALAVVFFLFFAVGFLAKLGVAIARGLPIPAGRVWYRRRLWAVLALLATIALVAFLVTVRMSGMSLLASLGDSFSFRIATSGGGAFYVSALALWCMWGVYWLALIDSAGRRAKVGRIIALAALFLLLALFTVPFGSRSYLLGPVVGTLFVLDYGRQGARLSIGRALPVLALMLLFIGGYGVFRDLSYGGSFSSQALARVLDGGYLSAIVNRLVARFDALDFLAVTLHRFPAADQGFLLGRSAVDFLVQPLPRALFSAKPYKTSALLTGVLFPDYPRTFTPEYSLIAEAYINFGVLSVPLAGLLFGTIVRAIGEYLEAHRHNPSVLFWWAPVVTAPMAWLMSGFNSDASVGVIMNLVLGLLVLKVIRRGKGLR